MVAYLYLHEFSGIYNFTPHLGALFFLFVTDNSIHFLGLETTSTMHHFLSFHQAEKTEAACSEKFSCHLVTWSAVEIDPTNNKCWARI